MEVKLLVADISEESRNEVLAVKLEVAVIEDDITLVSDEVIVEFPVTEVVPGLVNIADKLLVLVIVLSSTFLKLDNIELEAVILLTRILEISAVIVEVLLLMFANIIVASPAVNELLPVMVEEILLTIVALAILDEPARATPFHNFKGVADIEDNPTIGSDTIGFESLENSAEILDEP